MAWLKHEKHTTNQQTKEDILTTTTEPETQQTEQEQEPQVMNEQEIREFVAYQDLTYLNSY